MSGNRVLRFYPGKIKICGFTVIDVSKQDGTETAGNIKSRFYTIITA